MIKTNYSSNRKKSLNNQHKIIKKKRKMANKQKIKVNSNRNQNKSNQKRKRRNKIKIKINLIKRIAKMILKMILFKKYKNLKTEQK